MFAGIYKFKGNVLYILFPLIQKKVGRSFFDFLFLRDFYGFMISNIFKSNQIYMYSEYVSYIA